jgi:hypothetical protein
LVAAAACPVEHEAHREGGLAVLAGPDRVRQLGQPGFEAFGRQTLQWFERCGPLAGLGVIPLAQLGAELEQPRQAVGALERVAPLAVQVLDLDRDLGGHEALRQRGAGLLNKRRVGIRPT